MIEGDFKIQEQYQELKNALKGHLSALAEHLAGQINELAPPINLKGSFVPAYFDNENSFIIEIGTNKDYASYPEFGTIPHWSPIAPLISWVESRQLDIIETYIKTGKVRRVSNKSSAGGMSPREKQIRQIAYRIRGHIKTHGTKAQFYMKRAIESMGLIYTIERTETDIIYDIDVANYLQKFINN